MGPTSPQRKRSGPRVLFRSTGQASHHHSLALSERRDSCIRMKLPRDLAGRALVKALFRDWGYRVVHQEGSHIILDTEGALSPENRPTQNLIESERISCCSCSSTPPIVLGSSVIPHFGH